MEDSFPDIGSMSGEQLEALVAGLAEEEREDEDALISGDDVQKLTDILVGKVPDADEAR